MDFILTSCTVHAILVVCSDTQNVQWIEVIFYIVGHHCKTHLYRESDSVSLLNPRLFLCSVRQDGFMTIVCASHRMISKSPEWSSWNLVCHSASKYWLLNITLSLNVIPCIFYQTIIVHKLCYIISFICLLLHVSVMTDHHRRKTFQYISRNLLSYYMFCMSCWNYIRQFVLSIILVSSCSLKVWNLCYIWQFSWDWLTCACPAITNCNHVSFQLVTVLSLYYDHSP